MTGLERRIAEWLNPYRVFWIKRITNLILIAAFIWAAIHTQEMFNQAEQFEALLKQEGCSVFRDPVTGEVIRPDLSQFNITNSS